MKTHLSRHSNRNFLEGAISDEEFDNSELSFYFESEDDNKLDLSYVKSDFQAPDSLKLKSKQSTVGKRLRKCIHL